MNEQERKQKKAALEAILFTMGRAVEVKVLMSALELEEEDIMDLLSELSLDYDKEDRGIRMIRLDSAYQLCTKAEYYDALIRVAKAPQKAVLTEVMMEVLSIIAYKQPVTRVEIERIRGVSSDYSLNRLIEYGLVEEAGRLDAPGRPILFRTTEEFLRAFGLTSVRELPEMSQELIEEAVDLAYEEAGFAMEGQMSFDPENPDAPIDVEI